MDGTAFGYHEVPFSGDTLAPTLCVNCHEHREDLSMPCEHCGDVADE